MIVERALYGLKSSTAAWRKILSKTMCDLSFAAYYVNPDV